MRISGRQGLIALPECVLLRDGNGNYAPAIRIVNERKSEIEAILLRAEEALRTARHGFDDLIGENRHRRFSGLRNLIVFGRTVTWIIQNLRSVLKDTFEKWYQPKQEEMRGDPLMRYFVDARNEIEKQGKLRISTRATIHSFSTSDMTKFGEPPPGAGAFFIGDQLGGSGWEVELPDGTKEKYYVDLPAEIGEVQQHFNDFPEAQAPELKGKSVEELSKLYLNRLGQILDDARAQFLGKPPPDKTVAKQLPPYIRVIK